MFRKSKPNTDQIPTFRLHIGLNTEEITPISPEDFEGLVEYGDPYSTTNYYLSERAKASVTCHNTRSSEIRRNVDPIVSNSPFSPTNPDLTKVLGVVAEEMIDDINRVICPICPKTTECNKINTSKNTTFDIKIT